MKENKKPENLSAFPNTIVNDHGIIITGQNGMNLRDYFAAKALSGLQANIGTNKWSAEKYAKSSYEISDAMLKQREL